MITIQRIASVLEPASSLALVDLATVKDELAIPGTNTASDTRLTRYILEASAQIHSFCRRVFPVQKYRNVFIPYPDCWACGGSIILSEEPIVEVLGLSEDSASLNSGDYIVDYRNGIIQRWSGGLLYHHWIATQIVVDFKAGFTTIPVDVQAAVIRMVTMQDKWRGRDPFLKVREGPTYGREEFWVGNMPLSTGGLPPDVAERLETYVREIMV